MGRWLNGCVGGYCRCERFASSLSLLNLVCLKGSNLIAHMARWWISAHIWVWLGGLPPFLSLICWYSHLCTIPGLSLGPGFQVKWSRESIPVIESSVPLSGSSYTATLFITLDTIRVDKIISQVLIDLPSIGVAHNIDDLGCLVAWLSCNLAFPALSNRWFVRGLGLVATLDNDSTSEVLCSSGSRGTSYTLFFFNLQWRIIKIRWSWFTLDYCSLKGRFWWDRPDMLSRITLGCKQHILQICKCLSLSLEILTGFRVKDKRHSEAQMLSIQ